MTVSNDDIADDKAAYLHVKFEDVVESGLIKQETIINQAIGDYVGIDNSADEIILKASLAKRDELVKTYKKAGIAVNPLLLIQLPSEQGKLSAEDKTLKEEVERQLERQGITYDNGKLAVWLSEKHSENLQHITDNNNPTEVLIFKVAAAVGWDCPRAQILVMLRNIQSRTFEIQTVGRILRMPEAKHYHNSELNRAFIYTNVNEIIINSKPEDLEFFKTKPTAHLKNEVENVSLPSVYLHRQDYGDLTASFIDTLVYELNAHFGIEENDIINDRYDKVNKKLKLDQPELQMPILADVIISNIDEARDNIGSLNMNTIQANVSNANIEREFEYLARFWSLPYAPVRSCEKIKRGIYIWFKDIGYPKERWTEVQKIITCSKDNQTTFNEVINTAKNKYGRIKTEELAQKRAQTDFLFSLPMSDNFGDNYEELTVAKYSYDKAYVRKNRSKPEEYFEKMLERSDKVMWWYKNGESMDRYFAIPYVEIDQETNISTRRSFYPDFIVGFKDRLIGIYDTKSGMTITDHKTSAKSDALQAYIVEQNNNGHHLTGGILNKRKEGLYLFEGKKYKPKLTYWKKFSLDNI
jgi:type III restriction enzyme